MMKSVSERTLIGSNESAASPPYSRAVLVGNIVWTSGALPVDGNGHTPAGFQDQVRLALENLHEVLLEAGADWSSVVKINGYVRDIELLPQMNEVYRDIVCVDGAPARTTVEVSNFRGPVLVEFDAVALQIAQA